MRQWLTSTLFRAYGGRDISTSYAQRTRSTNRGKELDWGGAERGLRSKHSNSRTGKRTQLRSEGCSEDYGVLVVYRARRKKVVYNCTTDNSVGHQSQHRRSWCMAWRNKHYTYSIFASIPYLRDLDWSMVDEYWVASVTLHVATGICKGHIHR